MGAPSLIHSARVFSVPIGRAEQVAQALVQCAYAHRRVDLSPYLGQAPTAGHVPRGLTSWRPRLEEPSPKARYQKKRVPR